MKKIYIVNRNDARNSILICRIFPMLVKVQCTVKNFGWKLMACDMFHSEIFIYYKKSNSISKNEKFQ